MGGGTGLVLGSSRGLEIGENEGLRFGGIHVSEALGLVENEYFFFLGIRA